MTVCKAKKKKKNRMPKTNEAKTNFKDLTVNSWKILNSSLYFI